STRVASGAFLPIVRDTRTDRCHILSARRERDSTAAAYSREMANLSGDTLITLLPTPKPAIRFAMAVWVSQQAFEVANIELPSEFDWQKIGARGWAGIGVDEKVLEFLNQFARALMDQATDQLVDFFAQHQESNCTRAKEIISMARAATAGMPRSPAPDYSLRAQIILRYALALKYSRTPERLDTVFELRVRSEFPTWTWESFQKRIMRLSENLHAQAFVRGIVSSDKVTSGYMVLEISKSIRMIQSIESSERIRACEEIAEGFRGSYASPPEEIQRVAHELSNSSGIVLNDAELRVLGAEPAFYYLCSKQVIKWTPEGRRPFLSAFDFGDSCTTFVSQGGKPGQLAETVEREFVLI